MEPARGARPPRSVTLVGGKPTPGDLAVAENESRPSDGPAYGPHSLGSVPWLREVHELSPTLLGVARTVVVR
eukprot:5191920-Pyramimonas_sp.AAC.1